jgi:hypothetical protein
MKNIGGISRGKNVMINRNLVTAFTVSRCQFFCAQDNGSIDWGTTCEIIVLE